MIDHHTLWLVIAALGLGSFGLRFVFLGLIGDRQLPDWALRHLRYTAVAVLPALVAPLVVSPAGGNPIPRVSVRRWRRWSSDWPRATSLPGSFAASARSTGCSG